MRREEMLSSPRESVGGKNTAMRVRPRSELYRTTLLSVDARTSSRVDLQGAMEQIRAEFAPHEAFPISLVARCYLGEPYEVHICDLQGIIVEHFERGRVMPSPEEGARTLSLHPDYAFIEVYSDATLVPVRRDGTVIVISMGGGS